VHTRHDELLYVVVDNQIPHTYGQPIVVGHRDGWTLRWKTRVDVIFDPPCCSDAKVLRDRCPRVYVCCIRNTKRLVIISPHCLLCKGDRRRVWRTQRAAHSLGVAYQEFYYCTRYHCIM